MEAGQGGRDALEGGPARVDGGGVSGEALGVRVVHAAAAHARRQQRLLPREVAPLLRGGARSRERLPRLAEAAGHRAEGRLDEVRGHGACEVGRLHGRAVREEDALQLGHIYVALRVAQLVDVVERRESLEQVGGGGVDDPLVVALVGTYALEAGTAPTRVVRGAWEGSRRQAHVAHG